MAFQLSSSAFQDGETIPKEFTCEGRDVPPPLDWSQPPKGTQSFALIVDDPDAPKGTFTHWRLYDIPAASSHLDEQSTAIGRTVANDFGNTGYGGPCPPRGHGPHRYRFTLHAVDVATLGVHADRRDELEVELRSHTLETTTLTGRYERT
jgi:Raf kinase inhibitor-like YbhB/YbcL family protein